MPLLVQKNKKHAVQSFVLKIVNNQCPELKALIEGPRLDRRVNLTMVVLVIPVVEQKPRIDRSFSAVTKEFSCTGLSVVLDGPKRLEEVILGFRWEGEVTYVKARAKHLDPIGGGFYQLGMQLTEILDRTAWPDLQRLHF